MRTQIERRESLDQQTREGLARVLDVLLPGTSRMPRGRDVGAHLEWLDRVLEADPRRFEALRELGARAAESVECTLQDIEEWAGDELEDVVFAFNAAYYMSPPVLKALGYPGQTRRPVAQATPAELCSDELIAPVRQRGTLYVPTPIAPDN
jgi:hypothetical protein